ncbi:MAG: quinolinate synthase NadA [Chloroflexi bacterium]|nr:quinolinate synthase NadA [Chloroflexota bacterium]
MSLNPELKQAMTTAVRLALAEDLGPGDVTSQWTLPPGLPARGVFLAKAEGVVAGLAVVAEVFRQVDPRIRLKPLVQDGEAIHAGQPLATVEGSAVGILSGERTALNFLQRMSGVASATHRYVEAVAGTQAVILDTRKTVPGLRLLDKWAVALGGGQNHRLGLHDMVLVKDNHIIAAGGITAALQRVQRHNRSGLAVEVEVKSLDELAEALAFQPPVQRIMLDNMDADTMRRAVALTAGRVPLEASGGVNMDTVRQIAETGVDYISVGALTHSVKALDISLDLEPFSPVGVGDEPLKEKTCPELDERTPPEVLERIARAKAQLGSDLVILAHHYQRDEIVEFADHVGDSLELSRAAAAEKAAKVIVFCGVDFMAETAAMLCAPQQAVLLPAATASCPMAGMATAEEAEQALQAAAAAWGADGFAPITYQNSLAEVKALCGRYNGAVCTSGNADSVLRWALDAGKRILFLPDRWLGQNTALKLGIPMDEIGLWDPLRPDGGAPDWARCQIVVWRGFCHVHTRFTVAQVDAVRAKHGPITVVVHPECPTDVVQAADLSGSTSFIIRAVQEGKPGSRFAIGTEVHMVQRLAKSYPDRLVVPLSASTCGAMARITPDSLLRTLEGLLEGRMPGRVVVPAETTFWANKALERMLNL